MELSEKEIDGKPSNEPIIGRSAPYFEGKALLEDKFEDITLNQYKGSYILLCFFSNACINIELKQFKELFDQFQISKI